MAPSIAGVRAGAGSSVNVAGLPEAAMFRDRYSQIFGRGERMGCILNFGHSFDAIEAYF